MRGPQNGDSTGDFFRGSSLNLEWSKRGIRLDDQWMFITWLHIEDFSEACLDVISIWDFDMLTMLTDLSWLWFPIPWFYVLRWYIRLRHRHIGLLLIDRLVLLSTLILILLWLFWSLHMRTLTSVYHLARHVDPLICILSWSSLSMMFVSLFVLIVVFSFILCVHDDIYELCLIVCCMTAIFLCDCMSSVYVGLTSIPLHPTLLVSVIPFISVLTIASVRPSVCLLPDRARD